MNVQQLIEQLNDIQDKTKVIQVPYAFNNEGVRGFDDVKVITGLNNIVLIEGFCDSNY